MSDADVFRASVAGFNAGWLNAAKSADTLLRHLQPDDARAVLSELIAEAERRPPYHPLETPQTARNPTLEDDQ